MKANSTYKIVLSIAFVVIWLLMIDAKFEEYDRNYGAAIYAFLLSCLTIVGIIILWFTAKSFIKTNKWITIAFLITASPLSIFLVVWIYQDRKSVV